jgi:hypothetical protein
MFDTVCIIQLLNDCRLNTVIFYTDKWSKKIPLAFNLRKEIYTTEEGKTIQVDPDLREIPFHPRSPGTVSWAQ